METETKKVIINFFGFIILISIVGFLCYWAYQSGERYTPNEYIDKEINDKNLFVNPQIRTCIKYKFENELNKLCTLYLFGCKEIKFDEEYLKEALDDVWFQINSVYDNCRYSKKNQNMKYNQINFSCEKLKEYFEFNLIPKKRKAINYEEITLDLLDNTKTITLIDINDNFFSEKDYKDYYVEKCIKGDEK